MKVEKCSVFSAALKNQKNPSVAQPRIFIFVAHYNYTMSAAKAASAKLVKDALAKAKAAADALYEEWLDFEDSLYEQKLRPQLMDGPKGSSVVRAASVWKCATCKEPAGASYNDLVNLRAGRAVQARIVEKGAAAALNADSSDAPTSNERARMTAWAAKGDWYKLLGLEKEALDATPDMVTAQFKKLIPRFHPDKARASGGGATEGKQADIDTENVYLALSKAQEVLLDVMKRRIFDSNYDFDESIPSEKDKTDFYLAYGPVFDRNARFSVRKPVPRLGDAETDEAVVRKFYQFWFDFETWRDFSSLGKHNIDQAEGRDEKRHRQLENKKDAEKGLLIEVKRLNQLVTRAHSKDPRVQAYLAREEEAKAAKKAGKGSGKREAEAAAASLVAAAADAAAKAEAAAKVEAQSAKFNKEKEKKILARSKAMIRRLGQPGGGFDLAAVEALLAVIEPEAALALHRTVFGDAAVESVLLAATADAEKLINPKGAAADKKGEAGVAAATPVPVNPDALTAAIKARS